MSKLNSAPAFHSATMGQNGLRVLAAADAATPAGEVFGAIVALEETAITAVLDTPKGDDTIDITLAAGSSIFGVFTNVDMASGSVIAYFLEDV